MVYFNTAESVIARHALDDRYQDNLKPAEQSIQSTLST